MSLPSGLRPLLQELAQRERHDPREQLVRLAVRLRARDACEYCLMSTAGEFHVDHIIPTSSWDAYTSGRLRVSRLAGPRIGPDHLGNLAWCCSFCNQAKGQRTEYRVGRRTYRLFDPRRDRWSAHFLFAHEYLFIVGITGIGRATMAALGFNDARLSGPLGPRHKLILAGTYPPPWAR